MARELAQLACGAIPKGPGMQCPRPTLPSLRDGSHPCESVLGHALVGLQRRVLKENEPQLPTIITLICIKIYTVTKKS